MSSKQNPYQHLPDRQFWRKAVADAGVFGYRDLWHSKWSLNQNSTFSTFGSCFAQHISRALLARQLNWFNAEPAPPNTPDHLAKKFHYDIFSARTGNIYTAKQFRIWVELATNKRSVDDIEYWKNPQGKVFDMLRPMVEPYGLKNMFEAKASLNSTVDAFRRCIQNSDVLVFTLGLTEGWINSQTGMAYSLCPGTAIGKFNPEIHKFHNYKYPEITADLEFAFAQIWNTNPDLKILLTVSPVPLVASASKHHVLMATQYSKSVLRAVAGDFGDHFDQVDYFPSYEIIAAPPSRAMFYEPNLRNVAQQGVDIVMQHFFNGLKLDSNKATTSEKTQNPIDPKTEARIQKIEAEQDAADLVCEELILDAYNNA